MYLKSLSLKGFKSFADKTKMVFDPGLTCVVGPNGSGKSNISDAVLWVLGTQSAKQLRGQAMEDVIFSGSARRGEVGLAEVTLVLDNSDHTLPIDYTELAITRRMFRNGENEYLVNGAPARLMDVQDILHDSGLGKETHSIISQGKLDSILTSKPEARRSLIEEAAGIAKYRRRKERAEHKMAKMDENVRHLQTLVREVNRRIKPLEGQVEVAVQAHELSERAQLLELGLAAHELRTYQEEWNALKERQQELEALKDVAELELSEKKQHLEKVTTILEEKGLFRGDIESARAQLVHNREAARACLRLLEEKGHTMVERLSDTRRSVSLHVREKKEVAEKLAEIDTVAAETAGKLGQAKVELEKLEGEKASAEDAYEKAVGFSDEAKKTLAASKEEAQEAELALSQKKGEAAMAKEAVSTFHERNEAYTSRIEALSHDLAAATARVEELSNQSEKTAAFLLEQTEKVEGLALELSSAREALDELKGMRATCAAKRAQAREVQNQLAQDTSALPAFLKDSHAHKLLDVLPSPKKHSKAFDLYLDEVLNYYLVTSIDELKDAEDASYSVFLAPAMESEDAQLAKEGACLASFVDAKKTDRHVLALLSQCYLVETLQDALTAHGKHPYFTYITAELEMLKPNGLVVKGKQQAEGFFANIEDIAELSRRLEKTERKIEAEEKRIETLEKTQQKERGKIQERQVEQEKIKAESALLQKETGKLEQQKAVEEAAQARLQEQNKETLEKMSHQSDDITALEKKLVMLQKRITEASREEQASAAKLTKAKEALDAKTAQVTSFTLTLAGLSERMDFSKTRKAELEKQLASVEERLLASENASRALEVLRLRIEPLHARITEIISALDLWIERASEQIVAAKNDSSSQQSAFAKAQEDVEKARTAVALKKEEIQAEDVHRAGLEVQVQNAVSRLREVATIPFEEAALAELDTEPKEAEEELARLRQELASLGPVNQVAEEEFSELKERQTRMTQALAELKSAKRAVFSVMKSIDKKMETAFSQTFEQVNSNFQAIFELLFPGGNAHLVLTEAEDIHEQGLEIVAQPRGKRLPKLALLSGGEKSLCALALLFAVYKTRTVPFYIFDEVEAALDDTNLQRLLHAIQELKKETQLIVITHQRATMEEADVLWGISMGGDGVSQVLSQRLEHEKG